MSGRYGQKDEVWVYNLVAQNTREGVVLQKVLSKMDVMREQMGSDRVYDVIDDWLEGVPLVNLIEKAIDSEDENEAASENEQPRLRIIQDPIPKLNPEMLYRQVQFLVEEADWGKQGETAETAQ